MQGFPLLVGIVGQQQISESDAPRIARAVRTVVDELRAAYPHTEVVAASSLSSESERVAVQALRDADVPIARENTAPRHEWIAVPQLVLLIWDGRDDGACQEAAAIREGRHREKDWKPLERPDIGPYYEIRPSGEIAKRYPMRYVNDERSEADFIESLRALNRYNCDLCSGSGIPHDSTLEQLRLRTDAVANELQRSAIGWQTALYILALIAAAIEVVIPSAPWWMKISAIVITLIVYQIARRRDVQNRYQDYRAIAEALRVQIAWWEALIHEPVDRAYLRMQQSELQWIRMLLRVAALLHNPGEEPGEVEPQALMRWIKDQQAYFERASNREARREERYHATAGFLITANIVLSIAVGAVLGFWHGKGVLLDDMRWVFGIAAAIGAVFVGLITSYARTRSFDENAKRYRRMYLVFAEAERELNAAVESGQYGAVRALARSLGREALTEQAEWLLAQRSRPVEIVEGTLK